MTPNPRTPSPSQLFVLWAFRAQRATALQTVGILHVHPARLLSPAAPPRPWVNPATGRYIL